MYTAHRWWHRPGIAAIGALLLVGSACATETADPPTTLAPPTVTPTDPAPVVDAWAPVTVSFPVQLGCCGQSDRGPTSPADAFADPAGLADGVYAIDPSLSVIEPDRLVVVAVPWVSCSDRPELCGPDTGTDLIGADLRAGRIRAFDLSSVTVVVRGIAPVDAPDPMAGVTGPGRLLPALVSDLDLAVADHLDPLLEPGQHWFDAEETLLETADADPEFPFARSHGYGPGLGPLAYRAPGGALLTVPWAPVGPSLPMHWTAQLEVRDGLVTLYVDGGVISG